MTEKERKEIYDQFLVENYKALRKRLTWISVKDELPEEDKRVLWCGPQGGMVVARFYYGIASSGRVMVRTGGKNFFATHWMPLPDPPEAQK